MQSFGELIKSKREEEGISLQKLSDRLEGKITPSYIYRLEKKERNPSFTVVCLLTEALNIDLREVFDSFGFSYLLEKNSEIDKILKGNKKYIQVLEDIIKYTNGSSSDISLGDVVNRIESLRKENLIEKGCSPCRTK